MRLLIAEDEKDLADALCVLFEKNQFSVDTVGDGFSAYEYASSGEYDAIILDIMMPKLNGIDVLKRLREDSVSTPVMMLTAKGQKDDRILGFNSGADDYLPKPFDTDELIARVRALLRRSSSYTPDILRFGDISLDTGDGTLKCNNRQIKLSAREYRLMELFMRSPHMVISADRIMERIWGWDSDAETSVVWVHISNLRKKLSSIGSSVSIRANRGLGYALETENKK